MPRSGHFQRCQEQTFRQLSKSIYLFIFRPQRNGTVIDHLSLRFAYLQEYYSELKILFISPKIKTEKHSRPSEVSNWEVTKMSPVKIQQNFSGSKTDGSFTTAVSNSFLTPLKKNPIAVDMG